MLQWDIQKQVGSLNNATRIFNTRKFDALTPIKIQWLDDGMAKQLSGLHVFVQGAVGQATFKGDQIIMAADATPIYWKDDGSGNQPNGVTIAKLPPQAFAQEGVFAGYFGLESDDGQRLTSVNTWFKVLGGTWNIGLGVNYFISDFDKALANAKGQIDQALADLRAKYTAQVQAAADALSADTQSLQQLAASVGQIQAQIDAGNVITRQQFNTEIADLTASNSAQIMSAFKAIGNGSPQFVDDLATLKTKYPTGKTGLFVTLDTGLRYAYIENAWKDFGTYQATGVADKSLTPEQINYSDASQSAINEITGINSVPWNDTKKKLAISFDGKFGYFTATTAATDQPDSGILFKVLRKSGDYKLYLKGITSTLSKAAVYITDQTGTLKWKMGEYFNGESTNESTVIDIPATVLDGCNIAVGDQFQVLLAVGKDEVGGKSIAGNIQLLRARDILLKRTVNLKDQLALMAADISNNQVYNLYRRGCAVDTKLTRWFSNHNYKITEDGVITYWWSGEGNPGPYYQLSQPVTTGQMVYVYFEARKISGENASIDIQFLNDHIFDATPVAFRLADAVTVKLSNGWESYFVPVELNRKWSKSDPTTAGATLSIKPGVSGETLKIQLRNVAFVHEQSLSDSLDVTMLDTIGMNQSIVPELAVGRRKGEFLPEKFTKSALPKVHYVSPKTVIANDNLYLDTLTVNLEKAEKVNFAIGAVDQNNLMIKSNEFSLDLPAGLRTIAFKEHIAIPAGNRLFMDCHNQSVLYASPNATEKILVEDEDHSISINGYSGYALYESTMMAPFSYRVRSNRLVNDVTNISTNVVAANQKVDDLQKASGILTSPQGKRYSLIVNDDGSLTTVSLQSHKAFIFGNSLTVGLDDYGMAASDAEHGWAYLVAQKFKATDPDFSYRTLNGGENWESKTSSQDRLNALNTVVKPQLAADNDLVIIQLTDNVNTNAKRATFAQDAKDLITWFRQQAPKARVVWVASWFALDLIPDVRAACAERGALLCDISAYARLQQYKSALGNVWTDSQGVKHTIDNAGVAAHPGDLGMQMIAQAVEQTLGLI